MRVDFRFSRFSLRRLGERIQFGLGGSLGFQLSFDVKRLSLGLEGLSTYFVQRPMCNVFFAHRRKLITWFSINRIYSGFRHCGGDLLRGIDASYDR